MGSQGAKGDTGLTGYQGAQGAQGAPGAPGPSDIRLKENIKLIENPLDKISKIRGVRFFWKKNDIITTNVDDEDIGFIAQELLHYLPETVFKTNNYYGVKYSDIIALCIEGIKEQNKILDELEDRLKVLESI